MASAKLYDFFRHLKRKMNITYNFASPHRVARTTQQHIKILSDSSSMQYNFSFFFLHVRECFMEYMNECEREYGSM